MMVFELRRAVFRMYINVSDEHIASIFKAEAKAVPYCQI